MRRGEGKETPYSSLPRNKTGKSSNFSTFSVKFWNTSIKIYFLRIFFPELKTLEWDVLNPDRLKLIRRLITRGEQAFFNLEIKKKSRPSINHDIHHSKVLSSDIFKSSQLRYIDTRHDMKPVYKKYTSKWRICKL